MTTTVAQLIAELQQYPDDAAVDSYDRNGWHAELVVRHPLDPDVDQVVLDGDTITPKEDR